MEGTGASPHFAVYDYEPSDIAAPADPTRCPTILVLGDSLAVTTVPELGEQYREHGYCVTIADGAAAGANTLEIVPGGEPTATRDHLEELAAEHQPDAVVFSFVGNIAPRQFAAARRAYRDLIADANAAGLEVLVTTPPVSAHLCDPASAWSRGHERFRNWVTQTLPDVAPEPYAPVRWSEVLTPGGTWEAYNNDLRFDDGVHAVRTETDCVHFSDRGAEVAAREIVAATQALWAS